MALTSRTTALVVLLLFSTPGCVTPPQDITNTREIQSLAIVGQCLMLKQDASICRLGRPFARLVINGCPTIRAQGGPGERVTVLPAGTRLRIEKVFVAVSYDDGLFQARHRHVFARIESGSVTSRLVDLGRFGVPSSLDELEPMYSRCSDP
jgi:hypothetical protein